MTLARLDPRSATKNEFLMMALQAFEDQLKTDAHYKNKFYAIFLIKNTVGSIIIDDREYELGSRQFFFINYNQIYYFKNQQPLSGDVILFTKSFYNHVYTGNKMIKSDTALHSVSPVISLKSGNLKDLNQTYNELWDEYQSHRPSRKEILCLLLKVFMLKFIRYSDQSKRPNRSVDHRKKMVDDFTDLVNVHYKDLKTTSKYAEKLSVTPNYLNILVKERLDITAGSVIRNRIILEAERLLLHTSLSIVEISYELGFNDNSHFGKFFKSVKGLSPNQFRVVQLG